MGFEAWELEGCNPPVRFLFVEWLLMALWDEIGFYRKNSFPGLEKVIFRTCLDCFQSTQDQYVDIFGHWLNKNWAALLSKPRKPHIDSAERLRKTTPLRDPNPRSSSATTDALTIVLQDPCLWRILQSYSLWAGCKRAGVWLGPRLRPKKKRDLIFFPAFFLLDPETNFQALKNCFSAVPPERWNGMNLSCGHCGKKYFSQPEKMFFSELRLWNSLTSPALQKHNFSGSDFLFPHHPC